MATYRELIVRGDDKILHGIVEGYRIAKNLKSGLVFCKNLPVETHHLKEVLQFHGDYVHVILSVAVHRPFVAALKRVRGIHLEIVEDRKIARASFEFKFAVFNKRVAGTIKTMFGRVTPGLRVTKQKEDVDPAAEGVEMYSPSHHYRYSGHGRIEGDFDKLIALQSRLHDNEWVDVSEIKLEV